MATRFSFRMEKFLQGATGSAIIAVMEQSEKMIQQGVHASELLKFEI